MPSALADIFRQAARLNTEDARRTGNVLYIEPDTEVLATGDLHGHRANLAGIIAYADLGARPERRLILQEIVHAPPDPQTGLDRSIDVLLRACRLKIAHPLGVVFLLGNHDVAQATGSEITKAGRGVCESFVEGVCKAAGAEEAPEVLAAIREFLLSMPIAARCPGGTIVCHTLPTPQRQALAGQDIPEGPYRREDLRRGGRVYEWTWGRKQTPEQIDSLAEHLGATFFVLAHKGIATPYELLSPKAIVLTAEHERGMLLQFPADTALTDRSAIASLKPLATLAPAG